MLLSKLTWLGYFSYDSVQICPSGDPLLWSFKTNFPLAQQGREEGRIYYTTICNNLQTLPVWYATHHTTEGTVNIAQWNYVVGEQAFMQSRSAPVIGAGQRNSPQVFQAIFAQIKYGENVRREQQLPLFCFSCTLPGPPYRWNHSHSVLRNARPSCRWAVMAKAKRKMPRARC